MSEDANTGRVEVRNAENDDIRAVQSVAQTTWDHTYRDSIPEGIRAEFLGQSYSTGSLRRRIGSNVFLVAVYEDSIVGFADFRPLSGARVELAAIYVLPEMQGRGIGARLLEAGLARLSPETELVLRVERDNTRAIRFYEARGFRRSGEFTERLLDHDFYDVEMVLDPRP